FFFQAEDGIRDGHVTGVQTCALPIWSQAGLDILEVQPDFFRSLAEDSRISLQLVSDSLMLVDVYVVSCGASVDQMKDRKKDRLDAHLGRVCVQLGSFLEIFVLPEVPGTGRHVCYDNTQLFNPYSR